MTGDSHIAKRIEKGCLFSLRYFNIFQFPLTLEEIYRFHPYPVELEEVESVMQRLCSTAKVYCNGSYYALKEKPEWIDERKRGEKRAYALLQRSRRYVSLIASFPFVRAVAISGSLSKYYASEKPDIDYFIITSANRLWISRTLLHLFKKLTFITGHQHYFCMNYFIDTHALCITHPNQYSAIEVATLLPSYNKYLLEDFIRQNKWVKEYLPNYKGKTDDRFLIRNGKQPLKKLLESILNRLYPDRLNRLLMQITDKKWRNKWSKKGYDPEAYDRAFLTQLHISKNHPADFEKKVLDILEENQPK